VPGLFLEEENKPGTFSLAFSLGKKKINPVPFSRSLSANPACRPRR
jgi:hypothetical protein